MHTPTGKARLEGYRNALKKHGIKWDPAKVKYGDSTMSRGYELCCELLEEKTPFSALFSCNDDMALGASKALHQAGLRIRRIFRCLALMTRRALNGWNTGYRRSICRSIT